MKVLCCPVAFANVFGHCLSDDEGTCLLLSVVTSLQFLTSSYCSRRVLSSYRCCTAFIQICVGISETVEHLTAC